MSERLERAVVVGASMAGLLAAAALSDHSEEVVLVERDRLPDHATDRRGVAQGRHAHALLARGQQVIEMLLPGITDELRAAGAPVGDVLADTRMYLNGHRLRPARSGLILISASRAFLEAHVRARVCALPHVRVIDHCDVTGLLTDAAGSRVIGVRLLGRADDSAVEIETADLVVDASGRNSRTPTWLAAMGGPPPVEERLIVDVAYATRRYRMGRDALDGDLAILNAPTADRPRAGALGLLEGDVGMVTLAGMHGDRPPLDAAGFDAFAASLPIPDISAAIGGADAIDDPIPHRFPASTFRRYERGRHPPAGFVAVGDAVCSLNPIYGQGMTLAALAADSLRRELAGGRFSPRRHARRVARVVRPAWQMAAGADLQLPGATARPSRRQRAVGAYIGRFQVAAANDEALSRAFAAVAGLVDPPTRLLHPKLASRVVRSRRG